MDNEENKTGDGLTEPWRELDYEVLPEEAGVRLDLFLNNRMEWRSRSSIQKLIDNKKVRVKNNSGSHEGKIVRKTSKKVMTGEVYGVAIPKPKRELEALMDDPEVEFPVLYEDEFILVINKPAGIPVHPGGRILARTVITLLNDRYAGNRCDDRQPLKLCHRLDIETSGVLLIGKDPVAQPKFAGQFEHRQVKKEYLALVHGEMSDDRGEIDLPIGLAENSRIHMKRAVNFKRSQPARTGYQVKQRLPGFTLVRLRLYTGRHHQLRVHLSAIGHPIVGDKVYGLDENFFIQYHEDRLDDEARARLILPRQALHAERLTVHHVVLNREMTFEAPMPEDIMTFMTSLESRDDKK